MNKFKAAHVLASIGLWALFVAQSGAADRTASTPIPADRIEVKVCVVPAAKLPCRTAAISTGGDQVTGVPSVRLAEFEDFNQATGHGYRVKAQAVGIHLDSGQVTLQLTAQLADSAPTTSLAQQSTGPTPRTNRLEDTLFISRGETLKRFVGEKLSIELAWKEGQSQ